MINHLFIEDMAGTLFPAINMVFMIIVSYQFGLLYKKPRGHMYYKPWHGLFFAFIFFSIIQVLTILRKIKLIVHPLYVNSILELLIILSLMYVVFAIKMRKKYHAHHHLNINPKKVDIGKL
jgi:hypothetical protein